MNIQELTTNWTKAQPIVTSFILSIEPNFQQVDDILQEVALTVVQKYDKYDQSLPFTAWAIGIAKNKIKQYYQRRSSDHHIFDSSLLDRFAGLYTEKTDELENRKRALRQCLSQIQPKWKKVLELRYSLGLEVKAIAHQLNISSNAAFIMLHRMRVALGKCIQRRLGLEEV